MRGRHRAKRTRRFPRLFAFIGSAAALVLAGCAGVGSSGAVGGVGFEPSTPRTYEVLYEVEGTARWADVTMATPTGTRQVSPDVPMTRTGSGERGLAMTVAPGTFLYISAQNNDGHGTIECRISVDGVVVSENSSSGGYAIASCEGTTP
jgi:hypothetical protein